MLGIWRSGATDVELSFQEIKGIKGKRETRGKSICPIIVSARIIRGWNGVMAKAKRNGDVVYVYRLWKEEQQNWQSNGCYC